jgi:hypothetical protein
VAAGVLLGRRRTAEPDAVVEAEPAVA